MSIKISSTDELVVQHINDYQATSKTKSKTSKTSGDDTVNVGLSDLYKSLTVLAQEVKSEIDNILGYDSAGTGDTSDYTPEKTAETIVQGTTALMSTYAKQNPDLEGEELISGFMDTIRGGISTGYEKASSILGDIGAYEFEGVEDGVNETMKLVEEKLQAFEDNWRKENIVTEETTTEEVAAAE